MEITKNLNKIDFKTVSRTCGTGSYLIYHFTSQIEKASEKPCQIIILGDANLCSIKWNDPGFVNKNVAEVLKNMLEQEGLQCLDVGLTYQANHAQPNGNIASSAIDHIYCSNDLVKMIDLKKLTNSATDHLPIVAKIKIKPSCEQTECLK